jgi:hypothetical protein
MATNFLYVFDMFYFRTITTLYINRPYLPQVCV